MMSGARSAVKQALGSFPGAADWFQDLAGGSRIPAHGYSLESVAGLLPRWVEAARHARMVDSGLPKKKVLVIGYLQWWLEHACALSLLLAATGSQVALAIVPYRRWMHPVPRFDARRQSRYLRRAMAPIAPLVRLEDLTEGPRRNIPAALQEALEEQSRTDVQYTLQREELDLSLGTHEQALFRLRMARNCSAASRALDLVASGEFDVVIVPNGSILEFGAVYQTARYLGRRVVTYEFGEQRGRMWLAQDDEVMRLDTHALWKARGQDPLDEGEMTALRELYAARRGGKLWAHFGRQWQAGESQGALAVRQELGLDPSRPVALLCTNVVGDSLALRRAVFTDGMADWLARTVEYFASHSEAQLVVRVLPGELLGAGHPSAEIVREAVPELPRHVVVVPPESKVNTYDLIELAHVGLVYTTTVGLEMAMNGVPVIVAGKTHYRGRGFTCDPESAEEYLQMVAAQLARPAGQSLSDEQVQLAWRYAYRFFFDYPFPFPWHLVHFWEDLRERPLEAVVMPEGHRAYRRTMHALLGEPIGWGRD